MYVMYIYTSVLQEMDAKFQNVDNRAQYYSKYPYISWITVIKKLN